MMKQLSLDEAQKYCVFENNENWVGLPSFQIRGVIPRPPITPLPHSDPVVVGVCHVQNEFFPVISLRSLLDVQYENQTRAEQQMMIMSTDNSSWGLLIDRAVALAHLEVSISTLADREDTWCTVVTGSASYSNQVLQVLDPVAVYQYAVKLLGRYWSDAARFEVEAGLC